LNVIQISIGNSAAYLGVAFAFFVLWRLDRGRLWNLLWSLGHALLALASLGTNVARATGFGAAETIASIIFGIAAAILLEGARNLAGRVFRLRRVALTAFAIALMILLIGEISVTYDNYASSAISALVYILIGLRLPRQAGSAYRYLGLLLLLRAAVVLALPVMIVHGFDVEGLIIANISIVATGIGLLSAALIDHDRNLKAAEAGMRRRSDELMHANKHLEDLMVYLELRNAEYAEAREKADIANRSKSQFLANMSHELRTPLNAIIGFSEMMRDGLLGRIDHPTYQQYLADINASGQHLLGLVNDILDLSRAEAGRMDLQEEEFDPAATIETCFNMVREPAQRGQVRLVDPILADFPLLRGDERRIRQIVLNLLSNAIKFTPPNGHVSLSGMLRGDGAFGLVVADTGIGMSPDQVQEALSPFSQIDSRLCRRFEGAGLGLPLSRRLLELHAGKLEIVSNIGVGTTVISWFPADRVRPPPTLGGHGTALGARFH